MRIQVSRQPISSEIAAHEASSRATLSAKPTASIRRLFWGRHLRPAYAHSQAKQHDKQATSNTQMRVLNNGPCRVDRRAKQQ